MDQKIETATAGCRQRLVHQPLDGRARDGGNTFGFMEAPTDLCEVQKATVDQKTTVGQYSPGSFPRSLPHHLMSVQQLVREWNKYEQDLKDQHRVSFVCQMRLLSDPTSTIIQEELNASRELVKKFLHEQEMVEKSIRQLQNSDPVSNHTRSKGV